VPRVVVEAPLRPYIALAIHAAGGWIAAYELAVRGNGFGLIIHGAALYTCLSCALIVYSRYWVRADNSAVRNTLRGGILLTNGIIFTIFASIAQVCDSGHPRLDLCLGNTLIAFLASFAILLIAELVGWSVQPMLNRRRIFWSEDCCGGCGYDLTGNVSGRCPECGLTIEYEDDDE
jgi:hypothetical protein